MDHDAVIIEVALNEAAGRAPNPHVPYGPKECADDALRCHNAGAAVVHWHARDPQTGEQRLGDAALYGQTLDRIASSGILGYPSYPIDAAISHDGRLAHVWELRNRHALELAPVDIGSASIVVWDERGRNFLGVDALRTLGVIDNPLPFVLDALACAAELEMVPTLGAFDVGHTRTMAMLAESGQVAAPVLHKIFLSGALALGPVPTEDAIDWHLAQIPDEVDVEWIVVPYAINDAALIERLARHALARGGGIRIGVGDSPAAEPAATNAMLVERAVSWARDAGRPVASSDDVRRRVGLPPRHAVP
jgi:3-keto-5-aminohexanoate cleavage enzyme